MITLLILIVLLYAFYMGVRRGIALQSIHTIGALLSFVFANAFYETVAKKIELLVPYLSVTPDTKMVFYNLEEAFDLDKMYYAGVAYIGLFAIGWLVTKFIAIFFHEWRFKVPFAYQGVVAGMINLLLVYTMFLMGFIVLSTIPLNMVQQLFEKSALTTFMVEKTPILSHLFHELWTVGMTH